MSPIVKYGGGFLIFCLILVGFMTAMSNSTPQTSAYQGTGTAIQQPKPLPPTVTQPTTPTSVLIKAEDIIIFPKSSVACLTREGLAQFIEYGASGEATKLQSMMIAPDNENGQCIMLDPAKKFKVIHVEYNDANHPDLGLVEIVGKKIKSASKGAWALTISAERVSEQEKK